MSDEILYQQLGRFIVLFQRLESSLIKINTLIADEHYAVEILLTEMPYNRLVMSTATIFSYFVDLRQHPDEDAKIRFESLMNKCLELGTLRNKVIHSNYAHLLNDGEVVALIQAKPKLKKSRGGSHREVNEEDLSVESFEPYLKKIVDVLEGIN